MKIGLIPLDERPANRRYPAMLADIAGVTLLQPPLAMLSSIRQQAPPDALTGWLHDIVRQVDALIVSVEMLGYGGLIPSRITHEPADVVINRLAVLRQIKRHHPSLIIAGFNIITRIPHYNNAFEEPIYWAEYGAALHRYSALLDRRAQGQPVDGELNALQQTLPAANRQDFLRRRQRNHTVNLFTLSLLAEGVLDWLVLSSDDTSPYGLNSREKRWLADWAALTVPQERLLMYPGADEVGCTLLARLIHTEAGRAPTVAVQYAVPGGGAIRAKYEDGPLDRTVTRQIEASGGVRVTGEGDLLLAVNPPTAHGEEFDAAQATSDRQQRQPDLVAHVAALRDSAVPVAIADVAYPNGADPLLIDLLRQHVELPALAAYGGWNTAGNTIGTVLAQGTLSPLAQNTDQRHAQERFLLHRFVEDWGYQHVVRPVIRQWLTKTGGQPEPTSPQQITTVTGRIATALESCLDDLPGFAGHYRIAPGSVTLPWGRTFEVDFELQPVPPE